MCDECMADGCIYRVKHCLGCAARLVMSARPSRKRQEFFIAYASTWHLREDILNKIKELSE